MCEWGSHSIFYGGNNNDNNNNNNNNNNNDDDDDDDDDDDRSTLSATVAKIATKKFSKMDFLAITNCCETISVELTD